MPPSEFQFEYLSNHYHFFQNYLEILFTLTIFRFARKIFQKTNRALLIKPDINVALAMPFTDQFMFNLINFE